MSQSGTLDSWSCVGTSVGLQVQSVQRARIGEHDLAIWRGADGAVRAWQNRCPHRGMRLSFGFVRENRLTCLYHGWTYDGQGSCAAIPAHPHLVPPRTITTFVYDCFENAGLIWVASKGALDATPSVDGEWYAVRSIKIDADASEIFSALNSLDFDAGSAEDGGLVITSTSLPASPLNHTVRLGSAGDRTSILCAVQAVSPTESMLHISIDGPHAREPELRRAVSDWAKGLRSDVEARATQLAAAA